MTGGELHISTPTDAEWSSLLAGVRHDVYQLPAWAEAHETLEAGRACAVVWRDQGILIPLVRRDLGEGEWDAVSPYGYGGLICPEEMSGLELSDHLAVISEYLGSVGCVSAFLRLHPTLNSFDLNNQVLVDRGLVVVIDLAQPAEQRRKGIRKGHQADIRRAIDAGIQIRVEDGRENLEAFSEVYAETMRRIGASQYYLFDRVYFEKLDRLDRGDLVLVEARLHDELVGGALFTLARGAGLVGYHLSAALPRTDGLQPTKLLIQSVADWASDSGFKSMCLGGGRGASADSLFQFKRGFAGELHRFRTLHLITKQDRYSTLSAGAEKSDFFPLYRAEGTSRFS